MSAGARVELDTIDGHQTAVIFCPGCQCHHLLPVAGPHPVWSWNSDVDKPTFAPSLHVNPDSTTLRCHSWIHVGRIQFLGDSTHALRGQTVDLPPVEWH